MKKHRQKTTKYKKNRYFYPKTCKFGNNGTFGTLFQFWRNSIILTKIAFVFLNHLAVLRDWSNKSFY